MQRYFSPHWYYADSAWQLDADICRKGGKWLPQFLEDAQEFNGDQKNDLEIQKWPAALQGLKRLIEGTELREDQIAILECRLDTRQRIDAILCGRNSKDEDTAFLLELKTWFARSNGFDLDHAEGDEKIIAHTMEGSHPILHPSVQVNQYRTRLQFLLDRDFFDTTNLRFCSAVYLHNLENMPSEWGDVLFHKKFRPHTKKSRIFCQWNEKDLFDAVAKNISHGSGLSAMQKLIHISPMK